MEIPYDYTIHDIRTSKDFKGITISGYKRKDVLNVFQNSMINYKLEDAVRWCVELHATGLDIQIWNIFKNIYLKYININNPKIFFYLLSREKNYFNIIGVYPKKQHHIYTKNNQEIRNLFAELTAILTLTKKNSIFLAKSLPTINNFSFEKSQIQKRLISKNMDNIINFIYNSTSSEEKLALNEIINNLKNGTFQNCIYWYLWLEKIENIKKKDIPIKISENFYDHWTTILWNVILSFDVNLGKNDITFIKKMRDIYKNNFKLSDITKKKYYFFISFYIIKNGMEWKDIYTKEYLMIQCNANINKMYKNIKENIESNLSEDSRKDLSKKYYQLLNSSFKKTDSIKKIEDTQLKEDINKVLYTKYPEYHDLKNEDNSNNSEKGDELISKNMNKKDLQDKKEEILNKKIDALNQFVIYKNKTKKSVIDYYKNEEHENSESSTLNIKNIIFPKRK